MSYRHPALRESALTCIVYDDSPVLDCKDSENRVKCKINCDLFSFSRCILSSPRVKDSTFFSIIATFPQHFLPFLLWTGQKDRPKGNSSTKKEVSVDLLYLNYYSSCMFCAWHASTMMMVSSSMVYAKYQVSVFAIFSPNHRVMVGCLLNSVRSIWYIESMASSIFLCINSSE